MKSATSRSEKLGAAGHEAGRRAARDARTTRKSQLAVRAMAILCAIPLVVGMLACANVTNSDSGSWTICLYLCGSNLESRQSWGTKTLTEICDAKIPANTNVVIQAGGAKRWHNDDVTSNGKRFVVNNHELENVDDASEASMGEASTLADFLNYCSKEYPAEHTAIILWDHGGGPLKGACYDETQKFDALTLAELDDALAKGVEGRGGKPYDIVGFDACLMGSLETASILADDAHWLVASQEIEAGAGWDYNALFNALRKSPDVPKLAEAICDGYMKKCSKRGKDAAATLSVVDLSRIDKVEEALNAAITQLEDEKETNVQALRHLAFGTRYAESFGGSTKMEGRSNLVDLKGMAEGNVEGSADEGAAWNALAAAVDEAVTYRACGSTTTGANGLSIWYPQVFDADDLAAYAKSSPLSSYVQALTRLFDSSVGKVTFSDAGSSANKDKFSVTIDPDTAEAFFDLYVVNEAVDGSYADTNVDISDDWENLTFAYTPANAVAITLDGMVLDASLVSYEYDYEVFSAPVTVNGEDANLRIGWIWNDDEPSGGHYELLGVWNGIDHVTGIADRSSGGLAPGTKVGARSLSTDEVREEIVVGKNIELSEAPLAPGRYECHFVALDLMGNEYPSNTCTYEVDDKGSTKLVSIGNKRL